MRNLFGKLALSLAAVAVMGGSALAEWPNDKPITIVHAFPPGGDAVQRHIGEILEKELGQTVVFENMAGAGGATGTAWVARQEPDGYTLVTAYPGPAANYANTKAALPYKPLEDFEHIAQITSADMVLAVNKDFPADTVEEFIAYAKEHPGEVVLGNVGIGSLGHMIELAVADIAGVEFNLIPYNGSGPLTIDILSGAVDGSIDYLGENYTKQIEAGNFKALGIVSAQRREDMPDVPTLRESGIDFVAGPWGGLMAPKGTPKPIVDRIAQIIGDYLATPEAKEAFKKFGQVPAFAGPEEFHQIVVDEEVKWRDIINANGLAGQ
jgi:tripartite-type tricarboxylate transporter receptor subunit TctC